MLAQHFRNCQDQVGCGRAFAELAGKLYTDNHRNEHGNRLPEHGGFGFDAADAPAEYAESVDHRRVGVRANERVGVSNGGFALLFLNENDARQIFKIHLMNDARVGRDNGEIAKRCLPPAEKSVALLVALEFEQGIHFESVRRAELVHLHGVVNHQFDRLQWIDALGVAAQAAHGIAHGRKINYTRDAGKVLQQHAARRKCDFLLGFALSVPSGEGADFLFGNVAAIFGTQQVLQQNAQRVGQVLGGDTLLVEGVQPVEFVVLLADAKGRAAVKAVHERSAFPGNMRSEMKSLLNLLA